MRQAVKFTCMSNEPKKRRMHDEYLDRWDMQDVVEVVFEPVIKGSVGRMVREYLNPDDAQVFVVGRIYLNTLEPA